MSHHDELVLALSQSVDAVRAATDVSRIDPQHWWTPLEAVLPVEECGGFMFINASVAALVPSSRSFIRRDEATEPNPEWEQRMVWQYKHGITRNYLILTDDLRPLYYVGSTPDFSLSTFAHIPGTDPIERAIELAFQGIDKLGASRSTAYNDQYRADRNARLCAAGFTVVS